MFFLWRRTTWQQKGKKLKYAFLLYWKEPHVILIGNYNPLSLPETTYKLKKILKVYNGIIYKKTQDPETCLKEIPRSNGV